MTDRDKIAEIIRNARMFADPLSQVGYAEADALIANGVIVPPCKLGQKLYDIGEYVLGVVAPDLYELRADEMTIEKGYGGLNFIYDGIYINNEDIGKTVFLTKEEAEEKLKELGK